MALHGHTIIELRDVNTGERQLTEKDNLVTGAAQEIFTPLGMFTSGLALMHGTSGGFSDFLSRFFGGLVLYDTPLAASADTMHAPGAAHVTGCAGYSLADDKTNPLRGSSNMLETELDFANGMAKFVYEFGTAQGNGTIASVCLANQNAAYYCDERTDGLRTAAVKQNACDTLQLSYSGKLYPQISAGSTTIGTNTGLLCELDEENDCILTALASISSTAATVTIRRYAALLHSVSLFWERKNCLPPLLEETKVDLTGDLLRSDENYSSFNYDAENRKIYLTSMAARLTDANGRIVVLEIDPDTGEKTRYELTNQTGVRLLNEYSCKTHPHIGGYVYNGVLYCRSEATGGVYRYFGIPLKSPGSPVEITANGATIQYLHYAGQGRLYGYNASGYGATVLNTVDNQLYTISAGCNYYPNNLYLVPVRGRHCLLLTNASDNSSIVEQGLYLGIDPASLATINDLPTPLVKTADKTMKITYILREGA